MLRLVPRHLVDALSLCHSWRCHIMVLKMSQDFLGLGYRELCVGPSILGRNTG